MDNKRFMNVEGVQVPVNSILNPELAMKGEYFSIPTPMPFGDAIVALKAGKKVARAGWNGKGMYLGLCQGGGFRDGFRTQDFVYIKTAQDTISPWQPSNGDMLAEDWLVVE